MEAGAQLKSSKTDGMSSKFEFNSNDPPEVEMLLAILDPKKKAH